ncbi:MAG: membrane protein insertion efficiency factor YidD [Bacteroidia bacterium]
MLWSSQSSIGQSLNISLISNDTVAVTKKSFAFLQGNTQDGMTTIKNLFHLYKHYISSQDQQSCRFTPSCSEFAFISIKRHGFFIGLIDFYDRFTRCNPLSPENYSIDYEKRLYSDPVE